MKSKTLRRSFVLAIIALLALMAVAVSTTLAWYIFTVNARTTKLHMAAGTNVSLQISNEPDGAYSSSIRLERFQGSLNPVSTNRIQSGFQKVEGFTRGTESVPLLASLFSKSEEFEKDYYKTALYLRTNGERLTVYLADIGFTDRDAQNPISSAIRVGFVVPSTGEEYIFAVSDEKNPQRQYNTQHGYEGCVLDASLTDGTTVEFRPLNDANYCRYDPQTGAASKKPDSQAICQVSGDGGSYGTPVKVEVYIWLEGCDEDCTNNLCRTTLEDLSLSFAGIAE